MEPSLNLAGAGGLDFWRSSRWGRRRTEDVSSICQEDLVAVCVSCVFLRQSIKSSCILIVCAKIPRMSSVFCSCHKIFFLHQATQESASNGTAGCMNADAERTAATIGSMRCVVLLLSILRLPAGSRMTMA